MLISHPLDPLTVSEITTAEELVVQYFTEVNAVDIAGDAIDRPLHFTGITLQEPSQELVESFQAGMVWEREALVSVLDSQTRKNFKAIVSLNFQTVTKWQEISPLPSIPSLDESLAKSSQELTTSFENEDPAPDRELPQIRQGLKPIQITQPEGVSFQVEGYQIAWQKWQVRWGFTAREGLVLYQIGYTDKGEKRSIIYRASLAALAIIGGNYQTTQSPDQRGSSSLGNEAKSEARTTLETSLEFDLGIDLGLKANSLQQEIDCIGAVHYFDVVVNTSRGEPRVIPQAIALYEEDYGMLWKHWDWRNDATEVRRSRRLVIFFAATLGNYEYGFYWYFYQDGNIQYEVKLTGRLTTKTVQQHFFNVRLHMQVDGSQNSLYEVNSESVPRSPENPHGNAFVAKSTQLLTEQAAQRLISPLTGRYWKVTHPQKTNYLGQPVGYKLQPGENVSPVVPADSPIYEKAGFIKQHLWATPYHPQNSETQGLPTLTRDDRSLNNTNIVVWYTFGYHHVPRPEDFPVMPVAYSGFLLKPVSFFDRSPALDVPPSAPKQHCC
ncbi:MAG: tyramine oxidase [Coleofasciculaceae cyanobacterium SM2_1_6]|nr:tyramine oxidase [Coleofasciculaceae cyanobacterium SM2_1_6]